MGGLAIHQPFCGPARAIHKQQLMLRQSRRCRLFGGMAWLATIARHGQETYVLVKHSGGWVCRLLGHDDLW